MIDQIALALDNEPRSVALVTLGRVRGVLCQTVTLRARPAFFNDFGPVGEARVLLPCDAGRCRTPLDFNRAIRLSTAARITCRTTSSL